MKYNQIKLIINLHIRYKSFKVHYNEFCRKGKVTMNNLIINIQKYSIHDGNGIRTTVFFKGCPLECTWCHNPESQSYSAAMMYNSEKCTGCGRCAQVCPQKGIVATDGLFPVPRDLCDACDTCADFCLNSAREKAGQAYTQEELMKELEKDKMFYEESGGGITLSGGEVMTQDMDYLMGILKTCHKKGYSVNIDTCGHADYSRFERVLPYVDTFLYDIKHMDNDKHKELTGLGNELILSNLKKLNQAGAKIHLRIPLIEGLNTSDEDITDMAEFIKDLKIVKLSLLEYHSIGNSKYDRIDMEYQGKDYKAPTQERLKQIKNIFENYHIDTKIGG